MTSPETFAGISSHAELPVGANFEGISAKISILSITAHDVFENVSSSARMSGIVDFNGAKGQVVELPVASSETFIGSNSSAELPRPAQTFTGIMAMSESTQNASFSGVEAVSATRPTQTFTGIIAMGKTTQNVSFSGVEANSTISKPVSIAEFAGINRSVILPKRASFSGAQAVYLFNETVKSYDFAGIKVSSNAKAMVKPLVFDGIRAEGKVKIAFPDGNKVLTTYNIGVPLGAEKPLMEPKIKEDDRG
jgi:hypothetical protein